MVKCNLIKLGVGWPEVWPERTDLRHKLVRLALNKLRQKKSAPLVIVSHSSHSRAVHHVQVPVLHNKVAILLIIQTHQTAFQLVTDFLPMSPDAVTSRESRLEGSSAVIFLMRSLLMVSKLFSSLRLVQFWKSSQTRAGAFLDVRKSSLSENKQLRVWLCVGTAFQKPVIFIHIVTLFQAV